MSLKVISLLLFIALVNCQILPPSGIRRVRPGPTVITPSGSYQGQEETYDIFRRIVSFRGIRYGRAERFRQAVPVPPLTSTQRAWEFGPRCPQFSLLRGNFQGEEDCLFLNIVTPSRIRTRLPVFFLIHGGGLQFGSAENADLGPEHIIHENIITVAINYRLSALGFLSTGDSQSPGNYAIKDIILGLQWVRDNIESFGGNPNDITVSGSSGGAVAVHALVISQAAAGLFQKVIIQSGSLFTSWAIQRNPLTQARNLADNLGLFYRNNEEMVEQLRQVSLRRLMNAVGGLGASTHVIFSPLNFIVTEDPVDSTELRIFTAPIETLVRRGNINGDPLLTGYTSNENLHFASELRNNPASVERFNQNPNLLIPPEWGIVPNSPQAQEVITAFRNLYFNGSQTITANHALQWSYYASDRDYVYGMTKMIRLQRDRQRMYQFKFSYVGALNLFRRFLRIGDDLPGAVHGDDAFYLYRFNRFILPISSDDEAFLIQRRFVRLWTNFIKYGNPTPTNLDPVLGGARWPHVTDNMNFLDIDSQLVGGIHPFRERMEVWQKFDDRFLG